MFSPALEVHLERVLQWTWSARHFSSAAREKIHLCRLNQASTILPQNMSTNCIPQSVIYSAYIPPPLMTNLYFLCVCFSLSNSSLSSPPVTYLRLHIRRARVTAEGGEVPQRLALLLQTHDRVLLEHLARRLPRPLDHQTPLEHLHILFLLMICNRGRIRFW